MATFSYNDKITRQYRAATSSNPRASVENEGAASTESLIFNEEGLETFIKLIKQYNNNTCYLVSMIDLAQKTNYTTIENEIIAKAGTNWKTAHQGQLCLYNKSKNELTWVTASSISISPIDTNSTKAGRFTFTIDGNNYVGVLKGFRNDGTGNFDNRQSALGGSDLGEIFTDILHADSIDVENLDIDQLIFGDNAIFSITNTLDVKKRTGSGETITSYQSAGKVENIYANNQNGMRTESILAADTISFSQNNVGLYDNARYYILIETEDDLVSDQTLSEAYGINDPDRSSWVLYLAGETSPQTKLKPITAEQNYPISTIFYIGAYSLYNGNWWAPVYNDNYPHNGLSGQAIIEYQQNSNESNLYNQCYLSAKNFATTTQTEASTNYIFTNSTLASTYYSDNTGTQCVVNQKYREGTTLYTAVTAPLTIAMPAAGYISEIGSMSASFVTAGGIAAGKQIMGQKVHGAVFNDYAEYRHITQKIQNGRCVIELGDGSLIESTARLQGGAMIISDTFGFSIGQTNYANTPIAVSGRVLVYPYEDISKFKPGMAVCSGPKGTVSIMSREEIYNWFDKVIGYVSEIPTYEKWGTDEIDVNGRIWIKIK